MHKQTLIDKICKSDPFCGLPPSRQISTMTISTRITHDMRVELCILQSHIDSHKNISLIDYRWYQICERSCGKDSIAHPWAQIINLKLSIKYGLKIAIGPYVMNGNISYEAYNYIFNCETGLFLEYIITPGFINVFRSTRIKVNYIQAMAGIRLICNNQITSTCGSSIESNGQIILHAKKLENFGGRIFGKEIFGYVHSDTKGVPKSIDNRHGQIYAVNGLYLYGTFDIDNHFGLMESDTYSVYILTDGHLHTVHGKILGVTIFIEANGTIDNKYGHIESKSGTLSIHTKFSFDNLYGFCCSYGDCYLQVGAQIDNRQGVIHSTHGTMSLNI